MFGSSFNAQKLKPQLKMAVGRVEILKNKKSALLKQSMRQVAMLLAEDPPKEEKARIRGEALIRDDNLIEALEIIQLECELLHERIKLLEYSKDCPIDLVSVVSTLIWSAHRVDVPELLLIKQQFKNKYGNKFIDNAFNNTNGCLNERVVTKLSVQPPAAYLVQVYLEKICEQFEVNWIPLLQISTDNLIQPIQAPTGISVQSGAGTGLGPKINITTNNEYDSNNNNIPIVSSVPYNPNNLSSRNNNNNNNNNGGGFGGGGGISSPTYSDLTKTPTNNNNHHHHDFPTAPSFHTNGSSSSNRGFNNNSNNGGGGGGGMTTTASRNNYNQQQQQHSDVIVEAEYIIPPEEDDSDNNNNNFNDYSNTIPMAPPSTTNNNKVTGTVISGPPQTTKNNSSSNSSYADLAARFNQLRK